MGAIQRLLRENQSTRTSENQNPAPNNVPAPATPASTNPAPANPTPESPAPAPQPTPANPATANPAPESPVPANPADPTNAQNPANPANAQDSANPPAPADPTSEDIFDDEDCLIGDAASIAAYSLFEDWKAKSFATPLKVNGRETRLCYAEERDVNGGKQVIYIPLNMAYATEQQKADAFLCTSKDGKKFTPVDGVTAAILKRLEMARKMIGHIGF